MLRGAEALVDVCKRRIHEEPHHLSKDGDFSWEEVECLGVCANAPMVQIGKDTYEDLTPELLEKVLDGFATGKPPKPGSQIGRQTCCPVGGPTTLRLRQGGEVGERSQCSRTRTASSRTSTASGLKLAGAKARGAWDNTKALIDRGHDWIVTEVRNSGLRGRGGAGFRRASSGRSCPRAIPGPAIVINADESGPAPAVTGRSCGTIRIS
jgi:hypothetical protein